MNNAEFIEYLDTPQEEWFRGIATVRLYGKIILRFKIVNKKDGTGYFVAPANFRVSDGEQNKYLDACMLDSRMEHEDLLKMIRSNVNRFMNGDTNSNHEMKQERMQQQKAPADTMQSYQPDLDSCPF
ncbi:MAG: hypothetical protein PQJ44_07050 [Sphaerochaetaceae bacterium]|nr:hypothetical protein [Sphaerochaetaceae bacterium]